MPVVVYCSQRSLKGSAWYNCHREASVIIEGKPYCRWHNPVLREKKRQEREDTETQERNRQSKALADCIIANQGNLAFVADALWDRRLDYPKATLSLVKEYLL